MEPLTLGGRLEVRVAGRPVAQGNHARSPRGFGVYETSKGHAAWRKLVVEELQAAMGRSPDSFPLDGPVVVQLTFAFERPLKHYVGNKRGGALRANAPRICSDGRPADVDKLARCMFDALEIAGVVDNDKQLQMGGAFKVWDSEPHALVRLRPMRAR